MTLSGLNKTSYTVDSTSIGSGGEGDIYRAYTLDVKVVKIYKPGMLTTELEKKLKIMIEHPPSESVLSQVAWPLDMVYDDKGRCCGFIMPELTIDAELGEIYKYPSTITISAQQKISIAKNICAVISEVHKAGYVFGDFNPRNIGLNKATGLVSFLDTDTYHVVDSVSGKTYRCNVCASGYAAPELLKKCSDYISENPAESKNAYAQTPLPTFTQETDNFALAIHIFKLLMNGYTPFGGIIEAASVSQSSPGVGDTAVRRDNYCFKPGYKPQSAAIPSLDGFPNVIVSLFTRTFINGKTDPTNRPNAIEWHGALVEYEKTLVTCPSNALHQYDQKNTSCPLCEADKLYNNAITESDTGGLVQTVYAPPPKVAKTQQIMSTPVKSQPVGTPTQTTSASVQSSVNKNSSISKIRIGTGRSIISICFGHSIVLGTDGYPLMCGNNEWGQLGDINIMSSLSSLKRCINIDDIVSVSAGYCHTMALKANGDLFAWGSNQYGQLGVGASKMLLRKPRIIMSNVVSVSTGYNYTMAIRDDNSLWAWGNNEFGQLGDSSSENRYMPVKITDNIFSISAGYCHTVAITSNGDMLAWGNNAFGQLGDGTTTNKLKPSKILDNVISVSAGGSHTMIILYDGRLYMCGWNKCGQLGDGTTTDIYKPKRIMYNVVTVSAGSAYSTAITTDSSLLAWGSNQNGELGDGNTVNRLNPVWIMDNVADISAGDACSMALKHDGSLWSWGNNELGQLGDGTTKSQYKPVKIMDDVMLP
ncbi:MAG: hypothetical protein LBD23_15555 [Oscillospiraceae bacterium]|jgi:alpha-tubulin suppressor-like RCC1 family protein|nr:hypothetical protein [Oscillospiraceae bacterium]